MLHNFRRIFVVALCLALVCGLSITALAVSREYDGGYSIVDWSASVFTYSTMGVIEVQCISKPEDTASVNTEASVACRYLDNNFILRTTYDTESGNETTLLILSFPSSSIYHMIDASYDFWAEVPTSYGWEEFVYNSFTVEYEVQ